MPKPSPIIPFDMHVHLGRSPDKGVFTARDITARLDSGIISGAVVFPIDEAASGPSYEKVNARLYRLMRRDKRVLGFCRLNTNHPRAAMAELERSVKRGFCGVKLHPRSDKIGLKGASEIFRRAEQERLPVMLHTAHDPGCDPGIWEQLFLRHRGICFILAHSGKDRYRDAAAIAKRCPNVFLDASTLSFFRTKRVLEIAGPDKLVFASDLPYSHPRIELLKYDLILGNHTRARKKIFCENARRILGGRL